MVLPAVGALEPDGNPLQWVDLPVPEPRPHEIRIQVRACGVCHTELDEIEGRLTPPKLPVVPGHEVIGVVEKRGRDARRFVEGERVGVGWIHHSSGQADENLSDAFRATGKDVDGGYAEYMTVPEDYAYPIPEMYSDIEAAPLLCAGAVGYRALKLAGITEGARLGLTGYGGCAHLILQLCRHLYPRTPVYVYARDAAARDFAVESGAAWVGGSTDTCAPGLHAIIDTTPAWTPVVAAMANLRPGGRLVINAIRKEDTDKKVLAELDYRTHLWMEKELKTVANVTRHDIAEFLEIAATFPLHPRTQAYPLREANRALRELKFHPVQGAKVLLMQDS